MTVKMLTIFVPERYVDMLDELVIERRYPSRAEAIRVALWHFLKEELKEKHGQEIDEVRDKQPDKDENGNTE